MLNRRRFIGAAIRTIAVSTGLITRRGWGSTTAPLRIRLRPGADLVHVPADFVGLGFEMSSAATLGLLSVTNSRYVQLVRNLGAEGVLRVGGIVADFARYEEGGQVVAEPKNTVVTRASLEQLGAFSKSTGWRVIWSVNFAQGSLAEAVTEARAVARSLGSQLYAIELGNEVENYGRGAKPFRVSGYTYEAYRAEYEVWHKAISDAVPGVRFAAPDTASSVNWVERMAEDAKGDVQLLTTHYYRGDQHRGSAELLRSADRGLKAKLERLSIVARKSGIPWRMCETNSFSGGGLPGVSDTILGTLWTLDFMLLLAQSGCAGVNIETGMNQLGFVSSYSPIQDDGYGMNSAGRPYYGMLAFAAALHGSPQILPIDFDAEGMNVTSYICGVAAKPRAVVVINRESTREVSVSISLLGMRQVKAMRLLSRAAARGSEVTFGGASVDDAGRWRALDSSGVEGVERIDGGDGVVVLPPMSAVVLRSTGT